MTALLPSFDMASLYNLSLSNSKWKGIVQSFLKDFKYPILHLQHPSEYLLSFVAEHVTKLVRLKVEWNSGSQRDNELLNRIIRRNQDLEDVDIRTKHTVSEEDEDYRQELLREDWLWGSGRYFEGDESDYDEFDDFYDEDEEEEDDSECDDDKGCNECNGWISTEVVRTIALHSQNKEGLYSSLKDSTFPWEGTETDLAT